MIKVFLHIALLFCSFHGFTQATFHNTGNLKIFEEGQVGFHLDLRNDGIFDENQGLVGFYGDVPLTVSGALAPGLFDVEIANETHVLLKTALNVVHNANFIVGDFRTPKDEPQYYLNLLTDAFYTSESDISKVNGYASVTDRQHFTFPVGDTEQLRPLIMTSEGIATLAKCAYFFENPNSPSTFSGSFDTQNKTLDIAAISTREFWRLEGNVPTTVQISWNGRSAMDGFTDDIAKIVAVGYSKTTGRWESLAGGIAVGDLDQGFVASTTFMPDDYDVLTFGFMGEPDDDPTLDNYLVTANGDGRNDAFEIPELELYPNNQIQIYDRFGLKVFEMDNYTNEFTGFANINNMVVNRKRALPVGVYFYIVTLPDHDRDLQGFLYLAR